jgi:DNA-binding CsgD family transcriptional regulator
MSELRATSEKVPGTGHGEKACMRNPAVGRIGRLTPREHEVFELLADGQSNEELAAALGVTVRTVRAHCASILVKLEVNSRLQACLASYAAACAAGRPLGQVTGGGSGQARG